MLSALPIDPLLPEVLRCLRDARNLVLEAPPGAGKTTRIPPALLSLELNQVLVLEPRRLAARLAARRVAFELDERVGETAGYQVRFEEVAGPRTRLRFLTEGVLTRQLLADSRLAGVGAVILDEFHERHLEGDLALSLLSRLQGTVRPDLRLVVMSATMETGPVAEFLGGCAVLRSEGRLYELAISYTPSSPDPLHEQVARALERLAREGLDGDVLVFLPGAAEIRQAARACTRIAQAANLLLLPLHGDLSPEEQDRAVAPAHRRKVILSTNVAESSVTIDGVTAVIDSGLARVAGFSPWSGLPVLNVARISQASAKQRAGRAGRTGPGRVVRLYPAEDFHRRPAQDAPEITRRELSGACLEIMAMGLHPRQLRWLEPPPLQSVESSEQLLRDLGAANAAGELTDTGWLMARYPLHPRLSRLLIEAGRRGVAEDGCALAALLSSGQRALGEKYTAGPSDLLLLLGSEWEPNTRRIFQQLRRVRRVRAPAAEDKDRALLLSILVAFPDRVARRRQGDELFLSSGGSAVLSAGSVVRAADWMVAADIEERRERGLPLVRLASAVEPEWLLDLYPDRITERSAFEWNRKAERVETSSALLYSGLVLEESRGAAPDANLAARLLAEKAVEAGVPRFADPDELEEFLARVSFASEHSSIPALGEEDVKAALTSLCCGLKSFAELKQAAGQGGLERALMQRLPPHAGQLLVAVAPEKIRLAGGRQVRVRYERSRPPWVASRLQDFFGMRETPRVARGAVPVVVRLLARKFHTPSSKKPLLLA